MDPHQVLMYCQGLDCGPFRMAGALLRGGRREPSGTDGCAAWEQFGGRAPVLTHQARSAIALILRRWNIGPGDEVLVPAYNCGTDIDPVLKSGATVTPYPVGADLRVDVEEIRRRITPRTRLLYVIHYFGWPQPLAELRRPCDELGIKLLEDCALALFSRGHEGWLGRQGDAAVFSLPKTLGVPDGGLLLCREQVADPLVAANVSTPMPRVIRKVLPLGKRFLLRKTEALRLYTLLDGRPARQTAEAGPRPDIPPGYYFDPATTMWGMSRLTRGLLASVDPQAIVARRRHNYLKLLGTIRGLPHLRPLFGDLPEGVCPIGLPVLVRDRSEWVRRLAAAHIDVYAWWSGYHSGIRWDDFPDACRLKDEVLLLPVHQQLDDAHVDYIGRQVAAISGAEPRESMPRMERPINAA